MKRFAHWAPALLIFSIIAGLALGKLSAASGPSDPSLRWLKLTFRPTAEQFAEIQRLHEIQLIACAGHCEAVLAARAYLAQLQAQKAPSAEIERARERARALDEICRQSIRSHVEAVAAVLGGEKGRRYLEKVLPKLAHFDHVGAPGVDLVSTAE